ncbi:MAG: monovalent cation/H+ antiporter subunit D [Pseudomonadota bacterium]
MSHLIIAPVVLPVLAAVLVLLAGRRQTLTRAISVVSTSGLAAVALALLIAADTGEYQVYTLGQWAAPFGIVLVLDRLSALMLLLTAVVGVCSLLYAVQGCDQQGKNFHALFQFQLMGLNGAFLTGDLFNLFVFFEVFLIASYGLLAHGGGEARLRAGIHYVVINLAGSALFLIAVSLLYGVLGTLNMADLALKVAAADIEDAALIRSAALLLLVVFALKAALFPLYFWLPDAYSSASAPVAALFSIMTKAGVYSILRVYTLVFGAEAGAAQWVAAPWLLPAALATLALGMLGALASRRLKGLIAYLTVASVGTLMAAVGLFSVDGIGAALYYMAHSTLIIAVLFLLSDLIARQRGDHRDHLERAAPVAQPVLLGVLFFAGAIGVAGLPPLSGFIGKVMVLQSATATGAVYWVWGVVLAGGLLSIISLSQAGSLLFWNTDVKAEKPPLAAPASAAAIMPVAALLAGIAALSALAQPMKRFAGDAAVQLLHPAGYIRSVLG